MTWPAGTFLSRDGGVYDMPDKHFTALEKLEKLIEKISAKASPAEIMQDFSYLNGVVENTYTIVKNAPSLFSPEGITSSCKNIASLQKVMGSVNDWKGYGGEAIKLGRLLNDVSDELRKIANKKGAECDA